MSRNIATAKDEQHLYTYHGQQLIEDEDSFFKFKQMWTQAATMESPTHYPVVVVHSQAATSNDGPCYTFIYEYVYAESFIMK